MVPPVSPRDQVLWTTYTSSLSANQTSDCSWHPRQWLTIQVYPSSSHSTNLIPQNKANAYFSPRREQDADVVAKKATTGGRSHFIKLSLQSQVRLSVSIYFKSMSCAIAAVVLDIEIA